VKIDDAINHPALPGPAGPARQTPQTGSAAAGKTASDSVHLSPQLKALNAQLAGTEVFNADKVREIKAAIAAGRFQVNPGKVADGLLASVQDLINARKE
jgi:negative regulator of flagellin synthesis FlgM